MATPELKANEGRVLLALRLINRRDVERGRTASPKSWEVSYLCKRGESWASGVARKRLGVVVGDANSYGDSRKPQGLGLAHFSRNGHCWLTAKGAAVAAEIEGFLTTLARFAAA